MADLTSYLNAPGKSATVSYNRKDLIVYALGIGCTELRFTHEDNSDFAAFPTFPIVLPFAGGAHDVVGFPSELMNELQVLPPVDGVRTLLDGERYFEMLRPLPVEGEFTCTSKFLGIHARGQGALAESSTELSRGGVVYVRFVSGAFLVGAKGFKTFSKGIKVPERAPDAVESSATSEQQAHLYRLAGDYNPLHIDPDTAQASGFEKPILHGLCTLGFATRAVLKHFGDNSPARFRSVRIRFAKPVFPGETIVTNMWKEGNTVVFVVKVKERDIIVINNACVELLPAARI